MVDYQLTWYLRRAPINYIWGVTKVPYFPGHVDLQYLRHQYLIKSLAVAVYYIRQAQHMKSNSNKMVHVQINVDTCHTRAHNTITIPVYMTYIIWLQLINCAWICFSRCNIGYFNCHDELVVSGATWPGPAHCDRQLKALHDNGIDTWLWSGVNYQDLNLDPRIGAEGWEIPALHDYAVQFLFSKQTQEQNNADRRTQFQNISI